ncbi:MAG TPA: hypothetical protein VFR37_20090 [Longimicrobium sp.]|nr:hypothetical protein [Longimicrobium sp.]
MMVDRQALDEPVRRLADGEMEDAGRVTEVCRHRGGRLTAAAGLPR